MAPGEKRKRLRGFVSRLHVLGRGARPEGQELTASEIAAQQALTALLSAEMLEEESASASSDVPLTAALENMLSSSDAQAEADVPEDLLLDDLKRASASENLLRDLKQAEVGAAAEAEERRRRL